MLTGQPVTFHQFTESLIPFNDNFMTQRQFHDSTITSWLMWYWLPTMKTSQSATSGLVSREKGTRQREAYLKERSRCFFFPFKNAHWAETKNLWARPQKPTIVSFKKPSQILVDDVTFTPALQVLTGMFKRPSKLLGLREDAKGHLWQLIVKSEK